MKKMKRKKASKKPEKKSRGKSSPLIQVQKRSYVGGVLGVAAFAFCAAFAFWGMGVLFAPLFLLVGSMKLNLPRIRWNYLANLLWGLAVVVLTSIMPNAMVSTWPQDMGWHGILNALCVTIVCGVILILTARFKLSVAITAILLTILSIANGLVYQFRGNELTPMDFRSAGTALNVASQYRIEEYTATMVYVLCLMVLLLFMAFALPSFPMQKRNRRLVSVTWVLAMSVVLYFGSGGIAIRNWTNYGTKYNGYYLNFYLGVRDSIVKEPDRYDPDTVEEMAQSYTTYPEETAEQDLPNIIVIMNESWADFSILGELYTNQEVTPFLNGLKTNTIRGHALASIYGANTANSEFEFLFGDTMAFLPEGCVPYQQYVQEDMYALPWLMQSLGYTSQATHPYYANGWSRNRIYPYLGFSESTFMDAYPNEDILREYITDQEMFEYIVDKVKNKESDQPMFLFGITMQNHGGYTYKGPNYNQTIWLSPGRYSKRYEKAEQYLTCLHETDSAVQYLLRELRFFKEDTIVVMFGDHLPSLGNEFYEDLYDKEFETLDEEVLRYTIPFFIWANFDIEEQQVEGTSINYLSRYVLETAGIQLPPYYQFLKEMEEYIPALSAKGYYSKSQGCYQDLDKAEGEEAEWLNKYAILQYNNLFDEKNRNETFFGQYLPGNEE